MVATQKVCYLLSWVFRDVVYLISGGEKDCFAIFQTTRISRVEQSGVCSRLAENQKQIMQTEKLYRGRGRGRGRREEKEDEKPERKHYGTEWKKRTQT